MSSSDNNQRPKKPSTRRRRNRKTTEHICAGAICHQQISCRTVRWFKVESGKSCAIVCDAHLGWALARYGLPARVDEFHQNTQEEPE